MSLIIIVIIIIPPIFLICVQLNNLGSYDTDKLTSCFFNFTLYCEPFPMSLKILGNNFNSCKIFTANYWEIHCCKRVLNAWLTAMPIFTKPERWPVNLCMKSDFLQTSQVESVQPWTTISTSLDLFPHSYMLWLVEDDG